MGNKYVKEEDNKEKLGRMNHGSKKSVQKMLGGTLQFHFNLLPLLRELQHFSMRDFFNEMETIGTRQQRLI